MEGEFILIFINYYLNSFYTHTLILLCLIEIHKKKHILIDINHLILVVYL
jgi:hypothetical protein